MQNVDVKRILPVTLLEHGVLESPFCRNPTYAHLLKLLIWGSQSLVNVCIADESDSIADL